jgi:hypothetical protein
MASQVLLRNRTGFLLMVFLALSAVFAVPDGANAATSISTVDPDAYTCEESTFIDFENFPDGTDLTPEVIQGVQFTTTDGLPWLVGDFSTGLYNGKYPSGAYTSRGTHWAWLGVNQGRGRIDFTRGPASFVSVLVSALTPVSVGAYDRNGQLLETAGPSSSNIGTGLMDKLEISRGRPDIDHLIVHDAGNFFLIDALCANSHGTISEELPSASVRGGMVEFDVVRDRWGALFNTLTLSDTDASDGDCVYAEVRLIVRPGNFGIEGDDTVAEVCDGGSMTLIRRRVIPRYNILGNQRWLRDHRH